ncbi:MAG: glycosyltransferase family 4 protein [Patescibacteria group bacterium]|nr:glycosyltransferase family 4 protein [Patescibacteria group bacterium]MDE2438254.1 glycosyltransferase family 4 protein [Patescibacteria group bacterium]
MRILFTVEFYEPKKGGAEEVVRQLSERLVTRGHAVTVATTRVPERTEKTIHGVAIEDFALSGNSVKGIRGAEEEKRRYQQLLIEGDFDVIVNYAAQIWCTDLAFLVLARIAAKKVFVPCGYSRLHHSQYKDYYEAIIQYLAEYDAIVYMSSEYQDYKFGEIHGFHNKAVIIPNGAGDEFLAPSLGFKKRYGITTSRMVLTVANHYFAKGHLFVIGAFRKMKRDNTTLVIIGERPSGRSWYSCDMFCTLFARYNPRIISLHDVPREWVVSAYQEADLFLFGSHLECAPLVMYESFAAHTPFITTDVGNVKDHAAVLTIIKTPQDMARAASELLDSDEKRVRQANTAYELWATHHTWERIALQYEELFKTLVYAKE